MSLPDENDSFRPFDPRAWAAMTPEERVRYMAELFPQPQPQEQETENGEHPRT